MNFDSELNETQRIMDTVSSIVWINRRHHRYLRVLNRDKDLATALLKIGGGVTALWIVVLIVIFLIPFTDFF